MKPLPPVIRNRIEVTFSWALQFYWLKTSAIALAKAGRFL